MRALLALLVALMSLPQAILAQGDADRGAKVFRKCLSCHQIGPEAKNRTGPMLNDIIGASAGRVEGFKRYSKAMLALRDAGHVWSVEELDAYLENPRKYLPKTRMAFRGLSKANDRADVIAFLASHSSDDAQSFSFAVPANILEIVGDVEYGEYLASECVTCHKLSGAAEGIPKITGLGVEPFVTAMHAYRQSAREHPVMQMIAGRLSNEEIAALAAYFDGLSN